MQQCMKLTGTNSPIGLIVLINLCSQIPKGFASSLRSRPDGLREGGRNVGRGRRKLLRVPTAITKWQRLGSHSFTNAACMGQRCVTQITRLHASCSSSIWWFLRGAQNPIPSRTRPLNTAAPMVLSLKAWESRSPPGLQRTARSQSQYHRISKTPGSKEPGVLCLRGWWVPAGAALRAKRPLTRRQAATSPPMGKVGER